MKMNGLSVSRKVYADISARVSVALSASEESRSEAMRMVDSYLAGQEVSSDDALAMLAFNMIRDELDRAMARSRRARERAAARRRAVAEAAAEVSDERSEAPVEIHVSRRERRARERVMGKKSGLAAGRSDVLHATVPWFRRYVKKVG